LGCCNIPNIEFVIMTFAQEGMQLYAKPSESSAAITAFLGKDYFSEYRVSKTTKRVLEKSRLESLKKKISKEVESLEITPLTTGLEGYTFSGYRVYKTGGKCKFTFNCPERAEDIDVVDFSSSRWDWQIKTSSQKFKDNVEFIDDSNDYIQMSIKSDGLEFTGIRDTGHIGETINQEIEGKITDKFEALFQKKYLKILTSTKDLNRMLTISFNLESNTLFPVHFCYELDQSQPQSQFSCFIMPATIQ